ncbi:MAG: polyphenol oxidase family protein [Gemmatimonadales bacterium]
MTELPPGVAREQRVAGEVPRWEVPGWRQEFGVVAGVTGRGNLPEGDFDLGLWTTQPVGEVMGRWRRFLRAEPGFTGAVLGHQVHGREVTWHDGAATGWRQLAEVDGHATATSGLLLLVTVADCVPVYLMDPAKRAISLLHAGWRGVAAGILEAGIEALMTASGSVVENIVMHCGVAISGPCYEVGNEVVEELGLVPGPSGRQQLDLRSELARRAAGLGVGRVTVSDRCTAVEQQDFFSHRRSGGTDGRQVAYLGIPAVAPVAPPI